MTTRVFHPEQTGAALVVGPLEAVVLECLWEAGATRTVPEVHEALTADGRKLSYSAVKAVLNNLADKGWLAKERRGKLTCFEPKVTRGQFEADVMRTVIGSLKRNFGEPVIARFVDQLAVDENAIRELERLVARRKAELEDDVD
jgi:predicted transcriptional regulator